MLTDESAQLPTQFHPNPFVAQRYDLEGPFRTVLLDTVTHEKIKEPGKAPPQNNATQIGGKITNILTGPTCMTLCYFVSRNDTEGRMN